MKLVSAHRRSEDVPPPSGRRCIRDIVVPYECRKVLLQHLSAYDIAKLDLCLGHFLDRREQEMYLDPVRDLFWNIATMRKLLKEGMKLLLLGNDVSALEQRLKQTRRYTEEHGSKRRLQVFLVGSFPVWEKDAEILDEMIQFSPGRTTCRLRMFKDKVQFRRIQQQFGESNAKSGKRFLMSFGATSDLARKESKGFWTKVPDTPDLTIDLRIYVPCFQDRIWNEIRIPPGDISRISGSGSRASKLLWMGRWFLDICRGSNPFRSIVYIEPLGFKVAEVPVRGVFQVVFANSLPSVSIPL